MTTPDPLAALLHRLTWLSHSLPPEAECGFCADSAARLRAAGVTLTQPEALDVEACIGDPSHQYHSHDDDPDDGVTLAQPKAASRDPHDVSVIHTLERQLADCQHNLNVALAAATEAPHE